MSVQHFFLTAHVQYAAHCIVAFARYKCVQVWNVNKACLLLHESHGCRRAEMSPLMFVLMLLQLQ